ncbi:hypothetical protein Psch_01097 [Pelotomaculum schinkii]|uniref:Spermatogenesis-associated protein 20-like TRX domain-containing protein n=1 Tax=Pelotomaculum schinkii TaxID=78350 RepID=A0A4Y7RFQ6_9FIRM|nr:thioredoxin domain-containing protein [Pelotomaculum schinkii]TEB07542.1 hypothetical protein Psch_01097 [Pelotomaculum schinkii]
MTTNNKPNRLAQEKSPYLLQHAYNPVDWYPWGEEAFEKARTEDKLIFLSIGYSTCHWCHVMERESFEDEEVAEILNKEYVAIKVDREERPDIDHIYMTVCQAMTGHGGWPLTVLMTPEKKPFFAGTYFPKKAGRGMPGLVDILTRVAESWEQQRDRVIKAGEEVVGAIQPRFDAVPEGEVGADVLDRAFKILRGIFDRQYGGFGRAPKFPTPHTLTFLLRYWKRSGEKQALSMVEKTLESMYRGGIYDHIGYGFSRYATDEKWLVPHFEKMLYDNALLAIAYTETYQVTGKELYAGLAKQIFTYVLRDMTSPEGGFYSAEDADSEGEEGKFYVWNPEEITAVLGDQDGKAFCRLYNITLGGNFEGRSIPNLILETPEKFAVELKMEKGEFTSYVENLRSKLFEARERRVHPYKDDKILTSWNGLMIAALARGGAALGEPLYTRAAVRAVDFIYRELRRSDGRLLARYRDGEPAFPAYLDDYAFLIWGLMELYETTFEAGYLRKGVELTRDTLKLFWDGESGGFFFYGEDAEQLIARSKELYDGAIPSGNSVMLLNLLRLARLTGDEELAEIAGKQISTFAGEVEKHPPGYTSFLQGVDFYLGPTREVVIAGRQDSADTKAMLSAVHTQYNPRTVIVFHPEDGAGKEIEELAPFVREQRLADDRATAYVCQNYACQSPVNDVEAFVEILKG